MRDPGGLEEQRTQQWAGSSVGDVSTTDSGVKLEKDGEVGRRCIQMAARQFSITTESFAMRLLNAIDRPSVEDARKPGPSLRQHLLAL